MTDIAYLIIGLLAGGVIAAVVFLATRRKDKPEEVLLNKIGLLEGAQERGERMLREEMSRGREENANAAKTQREELAKSLEGVRSIVDQRLRELQEDNSRQIDKMRFTVDEKLHGTLEKRLGESFKLVSDRLEQVHQGLGAMRQLASDVGGLQRVLANVKTRGGWGEVQLGALLEQVLTADQFARRRKRSTSLVTNRCQISDRGLPASPECAGAR
jgi:DNA recombination protein RmuC